MRILFLVMVLVFGVACRDDGSRVASAKVSTRHI
jgi:hypothetical protein